MVYCKDEGRGQFKMLPVYTVTRPSLKKYLRPKHNVVGTQKNRLNKTVLLSTQNTR